MGPAAPDARTLTRVQDTERCWRELATPPTDDPVNRAAVIAEPTGLRRQQRTLSQATDRRRQRLPRAAVSRQGWRWGQNCSGFWAGVWLTLTPTEHGPSFLDCEYVAFAPFRLGLPLGPKGGPGRHAGGGDTREEGSHYQHTRAREGTRGSMQSTCACTTQTTNERGRRRGAAGTAILPPTYLRG